jgi:nitroreductase
MDFIQLAKQRYSCRKYTTQTVEKEKLLHILEAGRIAPSAANFQPCHFIVLQDKNKLERMHTCYPREWIKQAPVIIVICSDHSKVWKRSYDGKDVSDIDAAIAIDHMTLAATDIGLSTCWVCAFDPAKCREILNLPPEIEPIALLPLGYPEDQPDVTRHAKLRKPLESLIHWESY